MGREWERKRDEMMRTRELQMQFKGRLALIENELQAREMEDQIAYSAKEVEREAKEARRKYEMNMENCRLVKAQIERKNASKIALKTQKLDEAAAKREEHKNDVETHERARDYMITKLVKEGVNESYLRNMRNFDIARHL